MASEPSMSGSRAARDRTILARLRELELGTAKAWINFNGTGTIAIQDSFNVTSITDNGIGNYTVTFATDFANDDYAALRNSEQNETGLQSGVEDIADVYAVGSIQEGWVTSDGVTRDMLRICYAIFGDR